MGKCFITKLPAEVNNDDLPIYGKFNIDFKPLTSGTHSPRRGVRLVFNKDAELKIVGKGYFTNADKSKNLGTTLSIKGDNTTNSIYVSDEVSRISVDKYTLTAINFSPEDTNFSSLSSASIDIEVLKYSQVTSIRSYSNIVTGDISSLSGLTNLTTMVMYGAQISGDISSLSGLTKLTNIEIPFTKISGDISSLSGLTNLTNMVIYGADISVSGDASSLSGLTKLTNIEIQNTNVYNITVELINKWSSLKHCIIPNISGDIAQVHDGMNYLMISNNSYEPCTVSWTANSRQNKKLLCLPSMGGYLDFGTDLDNMLIDQATCNYTDIGSYYGNIIVKGTRTSASDAALASIQNKGVTVTILS